MAAFNPCLPLPLARVYPSWVAGFPSRSHPLPKHLHHQSPIQRFSFRVSALLRSRTLACRHNSTSSTPSTTFRQARSIVCQPRDRPCLQEEHPTVQANWANRSMCKQAKSRKRSIHQVDSNCSRILNREGWLRRDGQLTASFSASCAANERRIPG